MIGAGRARLLIFAKYPRAGDVKTRLAPPLAPEEAARLYGAFLLDALDAYRALDPAIEPVLYVANFDDIEPMRQFAGDGIDIRAQRGATLGERLHAAFTEAHDDGAVAACAIGTDHPTLPAEYILEGIGALRDDEMAIGPADDGGYYLLALRGPREELFRDMPYSTPELFEATLAMARRIGMRTHLLPVWYDVDDRDSLLRLDGDRSLLAEGSRTGLMLDLLAGVMAELRGISEGGA
ncbi:MAG: TIGR04282 family arsenosugar biosynthesis glycosyltransferase [Candidatus Kapaibacterium sp.]